MTCFLSILAAVGLLIPIQFKDLKFSCNDGDFNCLATDAAAYLNEEFRDPCGYSFIPVPVCTIDNGYTYFGANSTSRKDANFYEAAIQACRKLDKDIDFSGIDHIFFIVPGADEADGADENLFWSKCSKFSESQIILTLDGKTFDDYVLITETGPDGLFSGHGNLCHEFCHLLGLKDFYDTDGPLSGGYSQGFWGELSLMDTGNKRDSGHNPPHLCAAEREDLGIKGGEPLPKGDVTLEPLERNGKYYRLDTGNAGETYFLECREGGDLMLSRIDKSLTDAGISDYYQRSLTAAERWQFNEVNCRPGCECASGRIYPEGSITFSIGALAVTSLRKSSDGVGFKVLEPLKNIDYVPLQDAVLVSWESEFPAESIAEARTICSAAGKDVSVKSLERSDNGYFFCIVDALTPRTGYVLTIEIRAKDGYTISKSCEFTTKAKRNDAIPFIYLGKTGRNEDGSFKKGTAIPLKVINATDAIDIVWTFNSSTIHPDGSGLFRPTCDGDLKARIRFYDKTLTISKRINLR